MRRAQNADTHALKQPRPSQNISPVCSSFVLVIASNMHLESKSEKRAKKSRYNQHFFAILVILISIRLKIEQNCRLFWDFFQQYDNEWFIHDFYIKAQSGCQMCLSAVKLDHNGELSGLIELIECMGICILSLTHGSEQRDSDVICQLWKTDLDIFL